MKILLRILALFLIMPVVELALLIQVDKLIGFWPTIAIILFTGTLGAYLAKREGLSVWQRFNDRTRSGDLPGDELLDGVIILVAGALLITPGVLTDFIGFIGLFPFTRAPIRKYAMKRIRRSIEKGTLSMGFGTFGDVMVEPSEMEYDAEPYWQGHSREVPGHAEEVGEPGPRTP